MPVEIGIDVPQLGYDALSGLNFCFFWPHFLVIY